MFPLLLWTLGLSGLWNVDIVTGVMFVILAIFVGVQYFVGKTVEDYQVAFHWYNVCQSSVSIRQSVPTKFCLCLQVWLSVAHMLPAYYRILGIRSEM